MVCISDPAGQPWRTVRTALEPKPTEVQGTPWAPSLPPSPPNPYHHSRSSQPIDQYWVTKTEL